MNSNNNFIIKAELKVTTRWEEYEGEEYKFRLDIHLEADNWALTLNKNVIGTHENGWTVKGEIHEDYFEWVNEFEATNGSMKVWGDFESVVYATSFYAFEEFIKEFLPEAWDYHDI